MEAKAITAMVCLSEGMTLTIHISQMKVFTGIAASVIAGTMFIATNAVMPSQVSAEECDWSISDDCEDDSSPAVAKAPNATKVAWQEKCAAEGKRYYERAQGTTFLGIPVTRKVTWQGCLTDGEAAMAGMGTTQHTQVRAPQAPQYSAPQSWNPNRTRICNTSYGVTSCYN